MSAGEHEKFLREMSDGISTRINEMVLGSYTPVATQAAPASSLTYERLKALEEWARPEKLTIGEEEHEVWGYSVHQTEAVLEGFAVLIEKRPPHEWPPRFGKIVVVDTKTGKGFVLGGEPQ